MANNAFRSGKKDELKKGFFETHGMALGGGVLALGMMVVGSQYMQEENLSADVTDEGDIVTEESTETTEEVAISTEEAIDNSEEETEIPTEGAEIVAEENSEEAESTGTTEEESADEEGASSEESIDEDEVVVADTSNSSSNSNVTNPVTQNAAPLYADPVEGNAEAAVEAEPTPSLTPAILLDSIPNSPIVPSGFINMKLQEEGAVESQEERNLIPVIPQ